MKWALQVAILLAVVVSTGAWAEDGEGEELEKLANAGDGTAQWALGNRELVRGNYDNSAKWYEKSAEHGIQASQYLLSMMYLNGLGRAKSTADGVKWLNAALLNSDKRTISEGMSPEVSAILAKRKDDGGEKFRTFMKRAEDGDACAQALVGMILKDGWLGKANSSDAEQWLRKAAERNFAYAQTLLGLMYIEGQGIERNRDEGLKWYRKAAEQKDPQACFLLGVLLYENGEGIEGDFPEAFKCFRTAADAGLTHAQGMLGIMYAQGHGTERSNEEYLRWTLKAAEGGLSASQYLAGCAYESGEGVKQSYDKAYELYLRAAKQGYVSAKTKVGFLSVNGFGCQKDLVAGAKWLGEAAAVDEPYALAYLGYMHVCGLGADLNVAKGLRMLVASADRRNEKGVEFLDAIAERWFRDEGETQFAEFLKSAEEGLADDQYVIFRFLSAVKEPSAETNAQMLKWLRLAAAKGNEKALAECKKRKVEWK